MLHERCINARSFAITQGVIDVLSNLIPDTDKRDAFEEIFALVKDQLVAFCIEQDRMAHRLNPVSRN
jgi:hypothetical protein